MRMSGDPFVPTFYGVHICEHSMSTSAGRLPDSVLPREGGNALAKYLRARILKYVPGGHVGPAN